MNRLGLSAGIFFTVFLAPMCASGNMAMPFFNLENARQVIVFGIICIYVVFIEGATIKFILFGLDGPGYYKAFTLSLFINLLSAGAGIMVRITFDTYRFEFQPNLTALLWLTLAVECIFLVLVFGRGRFFRALATGIIMNLLSYTVFAFSRFPDGLKLFWEV